MADGESGQESQRGLVRQDSAHDASDTKCTDIGSLAGAGDSKAPVLERNEFTASGREPIP